MAKEFKNCKTLTEQWEFYLEANKETIGKVSKKNLMLIRHAFTMGFIQKGGWNKVIAPSIKGKTKKYFDQVHLVEARDIHNTVLELVKQEKSKAVKAQSKTPKTK